MPIVILKMILRNMSRHKLRVTLTFLTVFFGGVLAQLYLGGTAALDGLFDDPVLRGTMLVKAREGAPMQTSLPNRYVEDVRKVPGVIAASRCVEWEIPPPDGKNPKEWGIVGIDPVEFKKIAGKDLDSLPPGAYDEFIRDETAFLASRGAAIGLGYRVGAKVVIPLMPGYTESSHPDFRAPPDPKLAGHFVGIIDKGVFSDQVVVAHASYMERALNWHRGVGILAKYAPNEDPDVVAERIEAAFAGTGREEVEVMMLDLWLEGLRTFTTQIGAGVLATIFLLGALALVLMIFNTSMSAMELLPQIGTLRALGLRRIEALALLSGEGILTAVSGVVLATLVVYGLTSLTLLVDMTAIDTYLAPVFAVDPRGTAIIVGSAFLLGVSGSVVPSISSASTAIASLRRS